MITAPNGWMFWPDGDGMPSDEVFLRGTEGWCEHAFERVGGFDEADSLGAEREKETDDGAFTLLRCFNCGSTSHAVRSCPVPLNHALVALSRALFHFHHQSADPEPERLHVAEEWKMQRLRWLDEFAPGEVRGPLLRDALGLEEDDPGRNVSWLYNMLDWGYPTGWASLENPKQQMLDRVIHGVGFNDEDNDMDDFVVFGDEGDVEVLQLCSLPRGRARLNDKNTTSTASLSPLRSQSTTSPSKKRWATYRTSLFSSALLPIYTGQPLPPLDGSPAGIGDFANSRRVPGALSPPEARKSQDRYENPAIEHPWRHPDAFSAFGPVGWAESYTRVLSRRAALAASARQDENNGMNGRKSCAIDVEDEDMDMSE